MNTMTGPDKVKFPGLLAAAALLVLLDCSPLAAAGAGALTGLVSMAGPGAAVMEKGGWQTVAVSTAQGPAGPADGQSAGETAFWEKMQVKFDVNRDICDKAKIPLSFDVSPTSLAGVEGAVVGVGAGLHRDFRRFPDGRLALTDAVALRMNLGLETPALDAGAGISVGLKAGVRLEGESVVIRDLGYVKSCDQLRVLLNPLKIKTILPLNAKHISEMQVGELWKMPVVFWAGLSPSVGATAYQTTVSVSFTSAREYVPTVSLFRRGEKELRFRLRIDRAVIRAAGGSVSAGLFPEHTALDAIQPQLESYLGGTVGAPAAKKIVEVFKNYLTASFNLSLGQRKGQRILIEYVLDPTDAGQMEALAALLQGGQLDNLRQLARLVTAWRYLPGHASLESAQELDRLQAKWGGRLETEPACAGMDAYNDHVHSVDLHVPLITNQRNASGLRYDRFTAAGGGAVMTVYHKYKNRDSDFFPVPVAGPLIRHDSSRNAYALTTKISSEAASGPALVYQQFESEVRHHDHSAREMLEEANNVVKYAGAKGDGINPATELPLDAIQPPRPQTSGVGQDHVYGSAFMSFSLAFSARAVADILASPASLIVKSFFNALDAAAGGIMMKVLSVSTVDENGGLSYSRRDIAGVVDLTGDEFKPGFGIMDMIAKLCATAARVVADIASVRALADPDLKAERLARLMGGEGSSGLAYTGLLRVLIQLAEPADVAAQLSYRADKKIKGEQDSSARLALNGGPDSAAAAVQRGLELNNGRYSNPAALSD